MTRAEMLLHAVAAYYDVTVADLYAHRRRPKQLVQARKVAMYLLCEDAGMSRTEVGELLDRDPSTVTSAVHGMRVAREACARDLDAIRTLWRQSCEQGYPVRSVHGARVVVTGDPALRTAALQDAQRQHEAPLWLHDAAGDAWLPEADLLAVYVRIPEDSAAWIQRARAHGVRVQIRTVEA